MISCPKYEAVTNQPLNPVHIFIIKTAVVMYFRICGGTWERVLDMGL